MTPLQEPPSVFDAARDDANARAVLGPGGPLSYAELAGAVTNAMAELEAKRLVRGEPVGLLARPTIASLVCLLALSELRVPMLLIHPRTPDAERERLLERAGARRWFAPDRAGLEPLDGEHRGEVKDFEGVFAIAPTSGSTGAPKLVLLGRAAIAASASASVRHIGLTRDDRWLLCLPLAHVGGLSIVTRAIAARSAIVLHDAGARGLLNDVGALAAALYDHGVTIASFVPTVLDALVSHDASFRPPPTLRAVLVGGAAASRALIERATDAGFRSLTTYGLTEACSQVTAMPVGSKPRVHEGILSAGIPLPDIEIALDGDGRIRVRGPNLCSGFVDSPSPFDADGWLVTEDRGRFDEQGYLFVIGRLGDRIITGGENVDPLKVEAALEGVPGVARAYVFGVPDERFGETVACALVCGPDFERDRFDSWVRRALARHEAPRRIAVLDAFALLANGKIDRPRTRALALEVLARQPARG